MRRAVSLIGLALLALGLGGCQTTIVPMAIHIRSIGGPPPGVYYDQAPRHVYYGPPPAVGYYPPPHYGGRALVGQDYRAGYRPAYIPQPAFRPMYTGTVAPVYRPRPVYGVIGPGPGPWR